MRYFLILLTLIVTFGLAGCGSAMPSIKPYKMDIQQGNVVTSKMLLKLRPGMTKSQVRFIMGTPLIVDSFNDKRWDYFYQLRHQGKIVSQRRVIVEFKDNLLVRVRGDVVAEGTPGADTGPAPTPSSDVAKKPEKKGLLDKLKFWKKDEDGSEAKSGESKPLEVTPAAAGELKVVETVEMTETEVVEETTDGEVTLIEEVDVDERVEIVEDKASKEPPSMLAVPMSIEPDTSAKVEVGSIPEDTLVEAAHEVEPVDDALSVQVPAKVKQDEKLIFRLDRTLDIKRVVPASESLASESVVQEEVTEEELGASEPSYFERILEKIGF